MTRVLYVLVLLTLGAPAMAQSGDVITDKAIGVTVTKSAEWQNLKVEEAVENFGNVEIADEEIREAAAKPGGLSLITFMKYPLPYQGINPTFKISLHRSPTLAGYSARQILDGLMRAFPRMFPDLTVEEGPIETSISGLPAAFGRMNYTLSISGTPFATTSDLWIIPRGDSYLMIGIGHPRDETETILAELQTILNSVKIDPQP